MNENRKARRFDINLSAVLLRVGKRELSVKAQTGNLSSMGVLLFTDIQGEVGDVVEYEISLPSAQVGGRRLHCWGRIVRKMGGKSKDSAGLAISLDRYEFVKVAS